MKQFAFVFPGQGSQKVGMLSDIAKHHLIIEETFFEASKMLGYDLWALAKNGPIEELNKTWKTQPVLLTASLALWRVWKQQGGKMPLFMAGHSLGEYSALVCANVIKFDEAIHLVEMRGKFMQEAVPENIGAMTAVIGLDNISIAKVCKKFSIDGQIVSIGNFNSKKEVVISGHKKAVKYTSEVCKAAGAKIIPLPISVPSHCILMKSAAKKLAVELKKVSFNTPIISVVNNVDVRCETSPKAIRDALIRQLYNPVQWVKTIEFISEKGIKHLYEVGPGKVLTNLTKRIVNTMTASSINKSDVMFGSFNTIKK